jgi:hypothetical protein
MTPARPAAHAPPRRGSFARAADAFRASIAAWRAEYALAGRVSALSALPRRHLGVIRALCVGTRLRVPTGD